jgi:hypothetical protein
MAYANIQKTQAVTATATPAGATSALTLTGVSAGSCLLILGSYYITSGITCELLSVADTQTNTWAVTENNQDAAGPGAILFAAVAHNVAAGDTTITATFTAHANTRRIAWAAVEISGAKTSAAVSLVATGNAIAGVSSVAITTGALAQTDNVLLACYGVWANWNNGISDPGGSWTQILKNSNGTDGACGVLIGDTKVTSLSSRTVTGSSSSAPGLATTGFVLAVQAAETGAYKYVFDNFDPADLTSSDTGITALVYRNGDYTNTIPEVYTGLTGSATDGTLEIATGVPVDVALTDTIVAKIFNSTKSSHFSNGAVVAA